MADCVSIFFIQQAFDDVWTRVVHECLAGGFDKTIEHRAKLFFNEFGNIFSVVGDIIFNDPGKDGTKGALVIKAIIWSQFDEVCIGAFLLDSMQPGIYLLVELNPIRRTEHADQFMEHVRAVGYLWCRRYMRVIYVEFLVEASCMVQHLHEDRKDATGVTFVEMFPDLRDVVFEVPQDMHAGSQSKQQKGQEEVEDRLHQQIYNSLYQLQIIIIMDTHQTVRSRDQFTDTLSEKEGFIRQLVERCDRQEKRIAKLLAEQGEDKAKRLPFSFLKPFLVNRSDKGVEQSYLCFRIKRDVVINKQPIWMSTNLELASFDGLPQCKLTNMVENRVKLCEIGIQKVQSQADLKFEAQLTKDVDTLKENIGKCEELIENLRQLKQLQIAERQQELKLHSPPRQEGSLSAQQLRQNIKDLQQELFKLTVSNQKLRERVVHLEEAESNYIAAIRELQEKLGKGSRLDLASLEKSKLSERQKGKKQKHSKIVLLNY